ncbi:centrosomal protein 20-like [Lytechinus variegatus]|uniref:centrosomal protein 20-like n=1 Tax=Lytechinus variegatus TaxID=7654 RepID=UPI001BB1D324|nr:centrosomal protein 20-like [Lytechinus variegatus]
MAQAQELKAVVKETLENNGVLGEIKARVRAEVFRALDDPNQRKPPLSNENMLINELIREYLEFNHYKYTSSVLLSESGQPTTPLDRQFLATELNLVEDRNTSSIPLLYGILSHFIHGQGRGSSVSPAHQSSSHQFRSLPVRSDRHRTTRSDVPHHSDVRVGEPFTFSNKTR